VESNSSVQLGTKRLFEAGDDLFSFSSSVANMDMINIIA